MPTTAKGALFAQEIKRSSEQFLRSSIPHAQNTSQWRIPAPPNQILINDDNRHMETEDPQVEEYHRYLQDEASNQQRLLEIKHWEEAYEDMFKLFAECSAKTSCWGDSEKWNEDYKEPCDCDPVRLRRVVLVDILS